MRPQSWPPRKVHYVIEECELCGEISRPEDHWYNGKKLCQIRKPGFQMNWPLIVAVGFCGLFWASLFWFILK